MQNYPNLSLNFLEHSICDGFRVTYPIFTKKNSKKNSSASAGVNSPKSTKTSVGNKLKVMKMMFFIFKKAIIPSTLVPLYIWNPSVTAVHCTVVYSEKCVKY
jgi:hypothetical protein